MEPVGGLNVLDAKTPLLYYVVNYSMMVVREAAVPTTVRSASD